MKVISFQLTEPQHEALRSLSADTGLSVNELIRRAIDTYLSQGWPPLDWQKKWRQVSMAAKES